MSRPNRYQLIAGFVVWSAFAAAGGTADAPAQASATVPAIQTGATVQLDYTLTVDGQVVDSSQGRTPLSYVHGKGQIIPGLERELLGLHVGDAKDVTVQPEDGYGRVDPAAFITVSREQLPQDAPPAVGRMSRTPASASTSITRWLAKRCTSA